MVQNLEIKRAMLEASVKQWMLAEALHLSESTVCRKLRKEMKDEEKKQFMTAIKELKLNQ